MGKVNCAITLTSLDFEEVSDTQVVLLKLLPAIVLSVHSFE